MIIGILTWIFTCITGAFWIGLDQGMFWILNLLQKHDKLTVSDPSKYKLIMVCHYLRRGCANPKITCTQNSYSSSSCSVFLGNSFCWRLIIIDLWLSHHTRVKYCIILSHHNCMCWEFICNLVEPFSWLIGCTRGATTVACKSQECLWHAGLVYSDHARHVRNTVSALPDTRDKLSCVLCLTTGALI